MDQFECQKQDSQCVRGGSDADLRSSSGKSLQVNDLISQMSAMKAREQICSGFHPVDGKSSQTGDSDEDNECPGLEDDSPPTDMSSALRSVALLRTWDLKMFHSPLPKLIPAPRVQTASPSSSDEQDTSFDVEADPAKEDMPSVSFQSKYMHIFPLYQDYCLQEVKEDLHRLKESCVSELINPEYLQSLQSRLGPRCHSEALSAQPNSLQVVFSSPPQPVRVTPFTLWQDLDEVKECGLLSGLTAREIRLQESMFELIGSEASYLRSLRVAVDHFYLSKALKQTLSKREHHILFSNIQHVTAASEKFLMDLEVRLGECVVISEVGDIVLQHCSGFHSLYVPYVTNMMYQEALINQLLQQNRHFTYSLKKLESDPVCQRQTLKSFLVLPFQRITRIKLLLETVLKLTEPHTDSFSNLEKAIDAIHEIVTECDKGVRKMKQIEELVCLEMLMDFGKVKAVPLISSCRFLVRQGPIKQLTVESSYNSRTSFVSIYLHLFNDLLIVSSKKDQRFVVVDHAKFPTHVTIDNLKTKLLGLPPDSFLLHLSESQTGMPTAMIVVAQTKADKETWMKALSAEL